jgi:phospholipid/cholesterol/gamma-HCH transport system ATP-binding protein
MPFRGEIRQYGTADEIRNTSDPVVRQFISGSLDGPIQMI